MYDVWHQREHQREHQRGAVRCSQVSKQATFDINSQRKSDAMQMAYTRRWLLLNNSNGTVGRRSIHTHIHTPSSEIRQPATKQTSKQTDRQEEGCEPMDVTV